VLLLVLLLVLLSLFDAPHAHIVLDFGVIRSVFTNLLMLGIF
jgi:hypothetical protein